MESSNSISPFDLLRQRLNLPDPWILTEAAAVSKRQDAPRIINRIFRRMWDGYRMAVGRSRAFSIGQMVGAESVDELNDNGKLSPAFPTTYPRLLLYMRLISAMRSLWIWYRRCSESRV